MRNKKGTHRAFTLIELIIVVAIILVVMTAIWNFFFFGLNTFNRGNAKSIVQNDVRAVSDLITSELRNATLISVTKSDLGDTIKLESLENKFDKLSKVSFLITQDSGTKRYFVEYSVEGKDIQRNINYEVKSKVLLNNINPSNIDPDPGVDPDYVFELPTEYKPEIYYKKP